MLHVWTLTSFLPGSGTGFPGQIAQVFLPSPAGPLLRLTSGARQQPGRRGPRTEARVSYMYRRKESARAARVSFFRNPIALPNLIRKNPFAFKAWNAVFQQAQYQKVWQPPSRGVSF